VKQRRIQPRKTRFFVGGKRIQKDDYKGGILRGGNWKPKVLNRKGDRKNRLKRVAKRTRKDGGRKCDTRKDGTQQVARKQRLWLDAQHGRVDGNSEGQH